MKKHSMKTVIVLSVFSVMFFIGASASAQIVNKSRLVVITDIGNEPDDFMSMVRLMLYSNEIDIEGLIASTSIHQSKKVSPELIEKVINAYGKEGVGKGKDSEGSEWIIKMLEKNDSRPLWVTVWGGANTLAQSLFKIRETRSEAEAK